MRCTLLKQTCVRSPGICMLGLKSLALVVSEISAFIRTDRARSTREYIYFMGSETLASACYILSYESSIPFYSTSNGYNYSRGLAKISTAEFAHTRPTHRFPFFFASSLSALYTNTPTYSQAEQKELF